MLKLTGIAFALTIIVSQVGSAADNPHRVVFEGESGPGKGKHIVFVAGDHEYRGEETLPALARIMAKRYGFKCSVFFTLDPQTGTIKPGSSHIRGLEALETADLMVVFLRFQNFEDSQMQHFVNYLERGGPIVGLRTSTHAFNMEGGRFAKYSYAYKGDEFKDGFGRQILGETWAGHYGKNHVQSSLVIAEKSQLSHPILRGVEKMHVQSGGYKAYPIKGSVTLARGRILNGMQADAQPDKTKEELPVAWVRSYESKSGRKGRVFATTHGASEDILNAGFRRLLVNGMFWAVGMEDEITSNGPIGFVGPYNPVTFSFGGYRKGIKPADLAGWESPILSSEKAPSNRKK